MRGPRPYDLRLSGALSSPWRGRPGLRAARGRALHLHKPRGSAQRRRSQVLTAPLVSRHQRHESRRQPGGTARPRDTQSRHPRDLAAAGVSGAHHSPPVLLFTQPIADASGHAHYYIAAIGQVMGVWDSNTTKDVEGDSPGATKTRVRKGNRGEGEGEEWGALAGTERGDRRSNISSPGKCRQRTARRRALRAGGAGREGWVCARHKARNSAGSRGPAAGFLRGRWLSGGGSGGGGGGGPGPARDTGRAGRRQASTVQTSYVTEVSNVEREIYIYAATIRFTRV
ncbi:uncharacterized protein LOC124776044 [Schistocerca piceifrons]|uniref:uncharacterized protein LOC124776044 n=1 Tax=Schistocerca piceifrons TaxID=274613 RepID=UPI001F5F2B65|nr:uncharacterized protein LOC124776044 [Schistocerca piceifrons]